MTKPLIAALCVVVAGFWAHSAEAGVADKPSEIRPLLIGQKVPKLTLLDVDGKPFSLEKAVAEKPAVIVVYRGGWCYFCNQQLSQLRLVKDQLDGLGYQIIAISPDPPEELRKTRDQHQIGVTFLSDPKLAAADALGIAYKTSAADFGSEEAWKHAVKALKAAGRAPDRLPIPSVFLISKRRTIFFSYVNIDFRVRLSAEVLLTAAKVYNPK